MRVIPRLRHRRVNRNRVVLIAVAAVAACLAVPGAAFAGALDQEQTDVSGQAQGVNNSGFPVSAAQVFTAGLTGVLDQVDLSLARNGTPTVPLTVEIREILAQVPTSTVLASQNVPPASVTGGSSLVFVPVVFPTPAPVVAGTQYAIVAYVNDTNGYSWGASPQPGPGPYTGGDSYFTDSSPPSTAWINFTGVDQAFKTYVAPTPAVPPITPVTPAPGPTGQRAAALKKCKKKHSKQARKKCKRKAKLLPA